MLDSFHPAVDTWFRQTFARPTPCQQRAWPAIRAGAHTVIAAPTGSGKTLAAFLCAIDDLLREGLSAGGLTDATQVLYISPLKALSNDVRKNLDVPLQGVREQLRSQGLPDVDVQAWVRTGDTPQSERERMRRRPPHILVTTPESLFILLTSESGRAMLSTVRTVIVDEIHALAGNKRGAHLALSLERLAALVERPFTRIGLSATQKPVAEIGSFLIGAADEPRRLVDLGHARERDLALEVTGIPLEAVMSTEGWAKLYERIAALIEAHRTTLVFVNTRRMAERCARHLAERLGEEAVTAHHGSLAREKRLRAEQRLKSGSVRALVATASLELGIDIGDIDLVCQIGSPRSVSVLVQRVGRSGHALGAVPKGRLFPTTRDELVECAALLDAMSRDELEDVSVPAKPKDVLAQQIVAEIAAREWDCDGLYACLRRAWPYRFLDREEFDAVVAMLGSGFSTRRGRRGAHLHHDAVNHRLRARRGARLTALTNGGAIPDQFDYDVMLEPEEHKVGTLNEDFAFESLPGDIFQLGNTSYRILRVEQGTVRVEDAKGQPPNIPFWFGEAPGRSDLLSRAVSRFRREFESRLEKDEQDAAMPWLRGHGLNEAASRQIFDYLSAARAALTCLPTRDTVVFERFFDEAGDTHLVIHSSFGSRVNRAWGLALRKRFCRKFNFELQAAALEDSIVLSLSNTHSFPLIEVRRYLRAENVEELLIQALLTVPMFMTHWRWVSNIALAVRRNRNGKRVPPQLQRMDAEDLMAVVFPDQLACQENLAGDREIPDHPLVAQTLDDCLHEVMDVDGLRRLLRRVQRDEVRVVARDLASPSPLAQEILAARPYAFLDDAPAEERRTNAVHARGFLDPQSAAELGRLDPLAVERVRLEAWPQARTADELHDALLTSGFVTVEEGRRGDREEAARDLSSGLDFGWRHLFEALAQQRRATVVGRDGGADLWVAAERLPQITLLYPHARSDPPIAAVETRTHAAETEDDALRELLRGRLEALGPVTSEVLCADFALPPSRVESALAALEGEGFVMRTDLSGDGVDVWCERRLLARIHRYTINKLRREIEPVSCADYMRFLFQWQRLDPEQRGEGDQALLAVIEQLEGFEAAAAAWEEEILTARLSAYAPADLDRLCLSGRVQWLRLGASATGPRGNAPIRTTPITLIKRNRRRVWERLAAANETGRGPMSASAQHIVSLLQARGALFFDELADLSGMLPSHVERILGQLVAAGGVTCDGFNGMRALLLPADRPRRSRARRRGLGRDIEAAGRWTLIQPDAAAPREGDESEGGLADVVWSLLRRYGVLCRRLLDREAAWMPPWRTLLPLLRRLEARGEIRGGRFVAGLSGEQFALVEAVGLLRDMRRRPKNGDMISVSGADPLNLAGIVVPGERVPALAGNRVLFRDGAVVATQIGRQVRYREELDDAAKWDARKSLVKRALHGSAYAH